MDNFRTEYKQFDAIESFESFEPFEPFEGSWIFENNLAVYRHWHGKVDRYDRPSLEAAIQNTKNNRNHYATYEAYKRDWFRFERGLGLFKAAEAAHQAT